MQNNGFTRKHPAGTMILRYVSCLLLIIVLTSASAAGQDFELSEISQGIYLHQGKHAGITEAGRSDIANIGFIIGERCVAVIDTGGAVTTGAKLFTKIGEITDKPVCYVINTHIHFDHILGNLAFAGQKPEFIGHVNLPDAVESNRGFFLDQFRRELGPDASEQSIIAPDKTVADELEIDLGNRMIRLTAYKAAHTHTDLTVYDLNTRTLWTGDLLFREHIPVLDGSLKGWIDAMEKMKRIDVAVIIPGHGPPGDGWDTMDAQSAYLTMLLNDTRQSINKGQFMEEAIESIGTQPKQDWLLYEEHHRSNVSKAFIELEWE